MAAKKTEKRRESKLGQDLRPPKKGTAKKLREEEKKLPKRQEYLKRIREERSKRLKAARVSSRLEKRRRTERKSEIGRLEEEIKDLVREVAAKSGGFVEEPIHQASKTQSRRRDRFDPHVEELIERVVQEAVQEREGPPDTNESELKGIGEIVRPDLDSLREEEDYFEGRKARRYSNYYERNPRLRTEAILVHGTKCMVCGFDFEKVYGEYGSGFIEVHHLKPLSELGKETQVDPKNDMAVVCSNCHRIIHRNRDNILTLEELAHIFHE